jgi:hypothetical protein
MGPRERLVLNSTYGKTANVPRALLCYCGEPSEGIYSIHP